MTEDEYKKFRLEIRECPFCGSREINMIIPHFYRGANGKLKSCYAIHCLNCYAQTFSYANKQDAIDAWNTRYEPPYNGSVPAGNERLKKWVD